MKSGRKMELRLCKGPKDPNLYACRHIWKEFKERGANNNETFMICNSCGLVCPIPKGGEYPPECIEHRIKQKQPELTPSLAKSQDEQKKLVNAKDFQSPRESGCGECEE